MVAWLSTAVTNYAVKSGIEHSANAVPSHPLNRLDPVATNPNCAAAGSASL